MTHNPENRSCRKNNTMCLVYHPDGKCPDAGNIGPCTCISSKEKCECKELSCKEGCARPHTHKHFFCEKCEPVADEKLKHASGPSPAPMKDGIGWEGEMEKWGKEHDLDPYSVSMCIEYTASLLASLKTNSK